MSWLLFTNVKFNDSGKMRTIDFCLTDFETNNIAFTKTYKISMESKANVESEMLTLLNCHVSLKHKIYMICDQNVFELANTFLPKLTRRMIDTIDFASLVNNNDGIQNEWHESIKN